MSQNKHQLLHGIVAILIDTARSQNTEEKSHDWMNTRQQRNSDQHDPALE
jgi:hypothetical protein